MPIDLYWDDDAETTLLCALPAAWTWDDLHALLASAQKVSTQRAAALGRHVPLILDLRAGIHFPDGTPFTRAGLDNAQRILRLFQQGGSVKGRLVIVGGGGLLKSVYDTLATFNPRAVQDVAFADTLDAARTLLAR